VLWLPQHERQAVDESVRGMGNWIKGNHDWARITGRYQVTPGSTTTTSDMLTDAVSLE
jgi:hypothetical protein